MYPSNMIGWDNATIIGKRNVRANGVDFFSDEDKVNMLEWSYNIPFQR